MAAATKNASLAASATKKCPKIEDTLRELGLFEPTIETRKREAVLGKLNQIIKEWVYNLCIKQGMSEQSATETIRGNMIYTFGSYRLGVHNSGSDIDTLCIGPKNIRRDEDFFGVLAGILKERPEVTELTVVPDAFVPLITFNFSTVPIDLVYGRLSESTILPGLDLLHDSIIKNIDDKSQLSLNGCRVTDMILRFVPKPETFRIVLRAVKYWAKQRFLYSNKLGFLGGVSWALLVANVCQTYPKQTPPEELLYCFFRTYEIWEWPKSVHLNKIQAGKKDMKGVMPIITPACPQQNSTYNVSQSTLHQMKEEFKHGREITSAIVQCGRPWTDLFEKREFFLQFRLFVRISLSATSADAMRAWEGFLESRVRKIIAELERTVNVQYAIPISEKFTDPAGGEFNANFFLGLITEHNPDSPNQTIDLSNAVNNFIFSVKSLFKLFDPETMGITITWHKRAELPEFCFPNGRPKRTRKRKRKSVASQASPLKKQKVGEDGKEVNGTEIDGVVQETEEEKVEIPVVPELAEIGGEDRWNKPVADSSQQVKKKPKVVLMKQN